MMKVFILLATFVAVGVAAPYSMAPMMCSKICGDESIYCDGEFQAHKMGGCWACCKVVE
ncbi:hypothetical protein GQ44DRAFT_705621 [Phaeosphaeriaceae sp. PMI808]|nr:hypothetical protein GQ44DRAFT_705621 [Phaeosphaeriaceae sp. PMI808]